MGKYNDNSVKMALSGRVPVNVSTENGPIKIGDYLTSSSVPGVAMRATEAGNVIGYALSSFDGPDVGQITMFVMDSYYPGGSSFGENGLTLIDSIRSENPRNSLSVFTKWITDGKQFLVDFISARITAIRGYFDELFVKKIHTEKICVNSSDGNEVCITGDELNSFLESSSVKSTATNQPGEAITQ